MWERKEHLVYSEDKANSLHMLTTMSTCVAQFNNVNSHIPTALDEDVTTTTTTQNNKTKKLVDWFEPDSNLTMSQPTPPVTTRSNDGPYVIPRCRTDQLWNSFFIKTAADWDHLDTTVHAASVQRFKALVAAT